MEKNDNHHDCIILYIMVVGFHHKKGCLIDYCYPPLPKSSCTDNKNKNCDNHNDNNNQDTIQLPDCWKSLPSLAIPDGAHNFDRDTVYFHLPDLNNSQRTVFGVACYQQIMTKILRVRTPDMTRSSVQKSVVILLTEPLYGLIERKLRIITRNYFQELDFSKTQILKEFYHSLSLQLLNKKLLYTNDLYNGLSIKKLFEKYGQQIIILFKLILLEKKILFIMSPIRELSTTILTLCSLYPGLLQTGMFQSHLPFDMDNNNEQKEIPKIITTKTNDENNMQLTKSFVTNEQTQQQQSLDDMKINQIDFNTLIVDLDLEEFNNDINDNTVNNVDDVNDDGCLNKNSIIKNFKEIFIKPPEYYCLPLKLFKCHSYCLPYCSISCFEYLNNPMVRSCLAGSSNLILQRWENDIDVFVINNQISIKSQQLKRILTPTVEDLRFITFLIHYIIQTPNDEQNVDNDDDEKELKKTKRYQPESEDYDEYVENLDKNQNFYKGSDAWCRYYFKNYLLHMLRCSLLDESNKEYKAFNSGFMTEWKQTYSYKQWFNSKNFNNKTIEEIFSNEIIPQHPFTGNRFNDLRFKLTNSFNNYQEQITKTVINSARSTLNSWISSFGSSNAGQQAKFLLNKTVKIANQLIEDKVDDDDDDNNATTTTTSSSLSSSSPSSSSSSSSTLSLNNNNENINEELNNLSRKQQIMKMKKNLSKNNKKNKFLNHENQDNLDLDIEEQETSV